MAQPTFDTHSAVNEDRADALYKFEQRMLAKIREQKVRLFWNMVTGIGTMIAASVAITTPLDLWIV